MSPRARGISRKEPVTRRVWETSKIRFWWFVLFSLTALMALLIFEGTVESFVTLDDRNYIHEKNFLLFARRGEEKTNTGKFTLARRIFKINRFVRDEWMLKLLISCQSWSIEHCGIIRFEWITQKNYSWQFGKKKDNAVTRTFVIF